MRFIPVSKATVSMYKDTVYVINVDNLFVFSLTKEQLKDLQTKINSILE
jgi:hypothetical protein